MNRNWLAIPAALIFLAACGDKSQDQKPAARPSAPPTLITVAQSQVRPIEVVEESVGSLENVLDPKVGAEVAGRVTQVLGFTGMKVKKGDLLAVIDPIDVEIQQKSDKAEVARLEALVANQERIVQNQQRLFEKNYISQNALDEAVAQRAALREQLTAARAKQEGTGNTLRKTRVVSPIDGEVELQIVASGDYVKVGDPLFQLVGTRLLRAHLPFPESVGPRLRVGQMVRLSSPLVPGVVVEAPIAEIRPTITATSRALDVLVKFESDGRFRGGGTVNAEVITAVKGGSVMVPEQSVVLRPAGKVVYVIEEGKALARPVETGHRKDGFIEIVKGLAPNVTVAVDGAGFLTNNAAVTTPQARGGAGKAPPKPNGPPAT
jgi:RND family efflux transporter MFP subunit